MRFSGLVLFAFLSEIALGQNLTTFTDANNRLYKFDQGQFLQIYYQPTEKVLVSTKSVCFVDSKGDIYAYYNGEKYQIAQTYNEIINTDHLIVVRTASVLRVFDAGTVNMLSPNIVSFAAGDSLVLFQNVVGGYLNYYYQGQTHEIAMMIGNYGITQAEVGSNVFVYRDNSSNHNVFWHGQFYELLNTRQPVTYACGQDVVAFNDPQHNTFSAFDNGYIIDLEGQFAKKYQCGDNFIYYQDAGDVHKVVREERITELGVDIKLLEVTDSLVIYQDYGQSKIWFNEKIYPLYNYILSDYQTDGGIVAYKNNVGGVSAFVRGRQIDITNTRINDFKLIGNTILLKYGPSSYSVWWNGKIYEF